MRISVVGCGWLGRPLAESLSKDFEVACFTRNSAVQDGMLTLRFDPPQAHSFWKSELFIIAIPPKEEYLRTLEKIALQSSPSACFILMSSTSVYREFDTAVDENSLIMRSSLQKEGEELLLRLREKTLILRLGGLMGSDRISGRWKNRTGFADGPVNYIHRDDVIAVVQALIAKKIRRGIFNLVAPQHPLRSQIHAKNAKAFGFEPGSFEGSSVRTVSSQALIKELGYSFLHPDPLMFWE